MGLWRYLLGFLSLAALSIWLAVFSLDKNLHLIACDVGQGDGILLQKGSFQILVDGGPGSRVVDCLGRFMPFWDREIDLVILTHPEKDHYGGLAEVFKRYRIKNFLTSGLTASSEGWKVLEKEVGSSGARVIEARRGLRVRSGLLYLDIVHPLNLDSEKTNNLSIVFLLRFGEFDGLFTGDIEPSIIGEIISTGLLKDVEYLKVPHHGSKNGLTKELLEVTTPEVAVISAGRNNSYGHPHKEVLEMLAGLQVLRTDELGDVEVISDGKIWWIR